MSVFDPVRINQSRLPSDKIPREHDDNVRFRIEMFDWLEDEGEQAEVRLLEWCRIDPLFWMDAMVWTKDPLRHPGDSMRPWISLDFQREEMIPRIEAAMGDAYTPPGQEGQIGHDLCFLKTRDVGASVGGAIGLTSRRFYCFADTIGRFVSINEDVVDVRNDPDTLFGKMDLLTDRLPSFFRDGIRRVDNTFERPADNCIIRGAGTTTQTGRGGRPHWLIADEFSAWLSEKAHGFLQSSAGSTACRIFIGTAQGMGTAFHRLATDPNVPKLVIPWTKHPWHTVGSYRVDGDQVALLDVEFWKTKTVRWIRKRFPQFAEMKLDGVADDRLLRDVYPFVKTAHQVEGLWDGRIRSVWFDAQELRYPHRWMFASEVNCDFVGSNNPFFDTGLLQSYVRDMGRAPFRTGELFQDQLTYDVLSFQETPTGRFKLWFHPPTVAGLLRPSPSHPYCMGVDISAGVSATPSVIAVWRCDTAEKIFKYVRRDVRPAGWAQWAYTVQRWFGKCPIMFEGGGVGNDFGAELTKLGANGVYWMKDADGGRKKLPGYHFNKAMKRSMLDSYGQALCTRRVINRDIEAVSEGFQFQMTAGVGVQHAAVANAASAADSEDNHGDEFTADALAWLWMTENGYGLVERPQAAIDPEEERAYKYEVEERERRYALSHW